MWCRLGGSARPPRIFWARRDFLSLGRQLAEPRRNGLRGLIWTAPKTGVAWIRYQLLYHWRGFIPNNLYFFVYCCFFSDEHIVIARNHLFGMGNIIWHWALFSYRLLIFTSRSPLTTLSLLYHHNIIGHNWTWGVDDLRLDNKSYIYTHTRICDRWNTQTKIHLYSQKKK